MAAPAPWFRTCVRCQTSSVLGRSEEKAKSQKVEAKRARKGAARLQLAGGFSKGCGGKGGGGREKHRSFPLLRSREESFKGPRGRDPGTFFLCSVAILAQGLGGHLVVLAGGHLGHAADLQAQGQGSHLVGPASRNEAAADLRARAARGGGVATCPRGIGGWPRR